MIRPILVAAAFLVPLPAWAQTTPVIGIPPSQEVANVAPQLVTFVGSQANFDNLVNGLALGQSVTLSTTLADGTTQLVTFTPTGGPLTPVQIAQTLEAARQRLISSGVATATAQQVAVTLMGGALPTPSGTVQVTGILPSAPVPGSLPNAASGSTGASTTTNGVTVQVIPAATSTPPRVSNTSDSPNGRPISDTPPRAATPIPTDTPSPTTAQQSGAPMATPQAPATTPRLGAR